ncbi:MAG: cytochrome c-type biogenesis protein [Brevirhabdus sp.]
MLKRLILVLALMLPVAQPGFAVQPDEILDDAELEARARELSKDLRCLVCRNENIDDSNATLARDLRLLVRERLVAGDTDEEAKSYIVERYGEYVLLNPPKTGSTVLLWIAGPLMFLVGAGVALGYLRRRSSAAGPDALSSEEQARLDELMGK